MEKLFVFNTLTSDSLILKEKYTRFVCDFNKKSQQQLSNSLPSVKIIYDYKTPLKSCFFTSQYHHSNVFISPQVLYFFLLSFHWHSQSLVRLSVSGFHMHIGCRSFLYIKFLWVSLVCSLLSLFNLTSYCLYCNGHFSMLGCAVY